VLYGGELLVCCLCVPVQPVHVFGYRAEPSFRHPQHAKWGLRNRSPLSGWCLRNPHRCCVQMMQQRMMQQQQMAERAAMDRGGGGGGGAGSAGAVPSSSAEGTRRRACVFRSVSAVR
jgi:hypothetical protein